MPILEISRPREYVNGARSYTLYIDDVKVGKIRSGKTIQLDVPTGTHTLKAKIDWCSSMPFEYSLNNNQTVQLEVSAFKHSDKFFLAFLLIVVVHIACMMFLDFYYLIILAIPFVVYLIYTLFFNRKNYLQIHKI